MHICYYRFCYCVRYAASSKNIKGFYWVFAKNLDVGRRYSTDEEDDHFKYRHDM